MYIVQKTTSADNSMLSIPLTQQLRTYHQTHGKA